MYEGTRYLDILMIHKSHILLYLLPDNTLEICKSVKLLGTI
jgi:hypothetical protein